MTGGYGTISGNKLESLHCPSRWEDTTWPAHFPYHVINYSMCSYATTVDGISPNDSIRIDPPYDSAGPNAMDWHPSIRPLLAERSDQSLAPNGQVINGTYPSVHDAFALHNKHVGGFLETGQNNFLYFDLNAKTLTGHPVPGEQINSLF